MGLIGLISTYVNISVIFVTYYAHKFKQSDNLLD